MAGAERSVTWEVRFPDGTRCSYVVERYARARWAAEPGAELWSIPDPGDLCIWPECRLVAW